MQKTTAATVRLQGTAAENEDVGFALSIGRRGIKQKAAFEQQTYLRAETHRKVRPQKWVRFAVGRSEEPHQQIGDRKLPEEADEGEERRATADGGAEYAPTAGQRNQGAVPSQKGALRQTALPEAKSSQGQRCHRPLRRRINNQSEGRSPNAERAVADTIVPHSFGPTEDAPKSKPALKRGIQGRP